MKKYFWLPGAIALIGLSSIAFKSPPNKKKEPADKIFINGKIITVDSSNSIAQAVAVKDGKILEVGTNVQIEQFKDANTDIVDLHGKTLIPGFIDGHSHFMSLAQDATANLGSPPMGPVKNIAGIISELQKYKAAHNIKDGEWIRGHGYDQDQLDEKRHPTKEDLDAAFPNNPVSISNISGHMLVANSAALKLAGIDSTTKNPAGGAIVHKPGSNEPTGLLQEGAMSLLRSGIKEKKQTLEESLQQINAAQEFYASYGTTTAQEGLTNFNQLDLLRQAAEKKALYIDIESLPFYPTLDKVLADTNFKNYKFGVFNNRLKLAGTKMIADGSPQGKTAFFTHPYLTPVPGCDHDCEGFPNITQEQFNDMVVNDFKHNVRVFVHCNGDGAIDMYIKAVEHANQTLGNTSAQRRPVVIHSQFARPDQLDKYKELGFLPSFFTNHTFFWGDVHVQNLGQERAYFSSPVKAALDKGIVFTNHTDFPVTPLNPLFLLWSSVNRESRSGLTIGPDQRLTVLQGLRALTINGAYEYFEEKTKGSIEKGKLADLIILSDDPTTIDPKKIKDITVLETFKEGKSIFKRK